MKNLSKFDLAMIIAFVVVAVLGGAGWYWLSGQLQTAMGDAASAASEFDKYSKKEVYLPTTANVRTLQANIDAMNGELDPLVKQKLQSPKSSLAGVQQMDTVDWKHALDDLVTQLNAAAVTHGVAVPAAPKFYYGFERYINTNPAQEATANLQRQQLAIGVVANILINANVKAIVGIKRTYEEDVSANGNSSPAPSYGGGRNAQGNSLLPGHATESAGGVYTAYPLEFEFDTDTESFRTVVNNLMNSDYVFVIRSLQVQNSRLTSPSMTELAGMAGITDNGAAQPSITASSPGAVAASAASAAQPTVGLQYLFGDETLHVRMRIDLIDWHGIADLSQNRTRNATGGTANGGRGARTHPAAPANPNGGSNTPGT